MAEPIDLPLAPAMSLNCYPVKVVDGKIQVAVFMTVELRSVQAMNEMQTAPAGSKKKIVHELIEYWINFGYLAFFLVAFVWYRRFVLAEYQVQYTDYWFPLIEAAVLAKVIWWKITSDWAGGGATTRARPCLKPFVAPFPQGKPPPTKGERNNESQKKGKKQ